MYPADYVDDLIQETLKYCKDDDNKPVLPKAPLPLASAYVHPDKLYHCFHMKNSYLSSINIKYLYTYKYVAMA